ncbi:hypothetical protein EDEG_00371 [Edhazardia aedis USNM 41457]|uniref:Uncharacterized protein n=1 Tax=Edhazardia aedis (strain USNM 41457) TaxID=1003232 RepID=J9DGP3_EDHAE|nr:hypothetical protein EDEG_00371 [Edhazardia aedis USNM 41457]|eukprot:EJW01780.1 hypothetical protein EDEG_00371 [Edhazardia aedis USNM 41457]
MTNMLNLSYILVTIICKVVLVDDIGLTKDEIETIKKMRQSNPNISQQKVHDDTRKNIGTSQNNDNISRNQSVVEVPTTKLFIQGADRQFLNKINTKSVNSMPTRIDYHEQPSFTIIDKNSDNSAYNLSNNVVNSSYDVKEAEKKNYNENRIVSASSVGPNMSKVFDNRKLKTNDSDDIYVEKTILPTEKTEILEVPLYHEKVTEHTWSPSIVEKQQYRVVEKPNILYVNQFNMEDEAKELVRKEKENLVDANRAHTEFLDIKFSESKQREDALDHDIMELSSKLEVLEHKLNDRKQENETIHSKLVMLKNRKNNLLSNQHRLQVERDKSDASYRLLQNNIAHLCKELDDLKSKIITTKDERNIYEERLKTHKFDLEKVEKDVNIEETRVTEYQKELSDLEGLLSNLKNRLSEFRIKRSKEQSLQNKLEMERERIIRSGMAYG